MTYCFALNASIVAECYECPVGTYSDGQGCIPCPDLKFTHGPGSSTCLSCDKNQYPAWDRDLLLNNRSQLAARAPRCKDCIGVFCSDTGKVIAGENEYLAIQADGSVKKLTCPPGYCKSGTSCEESYSPSPAVQVCCGENRAPSPMCGECLPGYREVLGKCIECDEENGGMIALLLFIAIAFLVVFHQL